MVIFPCVGVSQLFQWRGEQRWQLRLLLVGGSEQPEQRSQPELQLVEREPVEQQQSGVRVGVRSSQEFILVRGRESFECKLQKWLNVIRDRICLRIFFRPITRRGRRKEILRASLRLRLIWNIILWSCMNR